MGSSSLSCKEGPHEMIYDLNIFKGFSWKKITQIPQIFEWFFQIAIFLMRSSIR
jgi:hypothetical protein